MKQVNIILNEEASGKKVDERLFGSFVEHMGRVVYDGIYDPEHKESNEKGFRKDVMELSKDLGLSVIRYPGGNFVSGYNWEDGVGPKEERPTRLDLAWQATETNEFGTNEFMDWLKTINAEAMMAVNLGTRGVSAARDLIEYCNHPSGTYWSDLRKKHGYSEPHNIKLWCLGNEMDGPWQLGAKTATEYGRLAEETAKAMKLVDPSIELVVCGSSLSNMPTYPEWDLTVLDHTFDHVDYLALHQYYIKEDYISTAEYLANSIDFDRYIHTAIATIDYIKAKKRSNKTINISMDEWNVINHRTLRPLKVDNWPKVGVRGETIYTLENSLLVGSMLITMLKYADRVKIACQSLLANVSGFIMTEENGGIAWRQAAYYPMQHTAVFGKGEVLPIEVDSPTYTTERFEQVPYIDCVLVNNEETNTCTIFAVNKSEQEDFKLTSNLNRFKDYEIIEHVVLEHEDKDAVNVAEYPDNVSPHSNGDAKLNENVLQATLPKMSWNVIRFKKI